MIAFSVFGKAEPAGSKRAFVKSGRAIITDANPKSAPWKAEVTAAALKAMNSGMIMNGPLILALTFIVPRPKGHYGKRGLLPSAPEWPAVKPDLLKLARAIEDALIGVVYRDDSQIVVESLRKVYGEPARVEVQIDRAL